MSVAVTGIACRLPGQVTDSDSLWDLLSEGRNAWSAVPSERFNEAAFYHPHHENRGTTVHRGGHFIDQHPGHFDAAFFGVSPNEAQAIDPQHRLAVELAYEALENGGIPIENARGSKTAVFAATFTKDYDRNLLKDTSNLPKYHTTGTGEAILANRISYLFDLRGPSITLDTGCSGSLVALHQACMSLRNGESDMAIVIGVNLILGPDTMNGMSNLHMLSPDGRSYSFDERGAGYGRGEGVVAVLLKRLEDTTPSGDHVHSVIRQTGINQDGKTNGITTPNQTSQEDLMRHVYSQAGLDPRDTQYVEAHGTGTAAGDAVELRALVNIFGRQAGEQPLLVGSIKSNIGHTESTSGLAGVVKAIAALERGQVPPNADFQKAKAGLKLDEWRISIPKELRPWPEAAIRRASVNSFGYGGTNAHVILEAANGVKDPNQISELSGPPRSTVFTVSAKSKDTLETAAKALGAWVEKQESPAELMASLAHTLNHHRSQLPWRRSIVAQSPKDLADALSSSAQPQKCENNLHLGFIFTGQGAQWPGMGSELIDSDLAFSTSIRRSNDILRGLGCSWDLLEELRRDKTSSRVDQSTIAQPSSTALQIALVDTLKSFGVRPDMVLGHSSGEVAAAYCAGIISHETAMRISFYRSQISSLVKDRVSVGGSMLAVGLGEAEVRSYLDSVKKGEVVVACSNSPSSTTISGDVTGIDQLSEILTSEKIFNRKLKVDTAYHSHHMQAVADTYLDSMGSVGVKAPTLHFQSSVEANHKTSGFAAEYWVQNLVSMVKFCEALESYCSAHLQSLLSGTARRCVFVEIGPHSALAGPVRQTINAQIAGGNFAYLSALTRGQNAVTTTLELAGKLWELGYNVDLQAANASSGSAQPLKLLASLPSYPWDHSTVHWHETRLSRNYLHRRHAPHDLLGLRIPSSTDLEPAWTHFIDQETLPWLRDHVIDGLVIFPGAGYVSMVIEAVRQFHVDTKPKEEIESFRLRNVSFLKALVVPAAPARVEMQIRLHIRKQRSQTWYDFVISAGAAEGTWYDHCKGSATVEAGGSERAGLLGASINQWSDQVGTETQELSPEDVYTQFSAVGNTYGPTFAAVDSLKLRSGSALATIRIPDTESTMPAQYEQPHVIHPATLDAIMHPAVSLYMQQNGLSSVMPAGIGEMRVFTNLPSQNGSNLNVITDLTSTGIRSANVDRLSVSAKGFQEPLLQLKDLDVRGVGQSKKLKSQDKPQMTYETLWELDVDFIGSSMKTPAHSGASTPSRDRLQPAIIDEGYNSATTDASSDTDIDRNPRMPSIRQFLQALVFKQPHLDILFTGAESIADLIEAQVPESFSCRSCDAIGISSERHASFMTAFRASQGEVLAESLDTENARKYDLIMHFSNDETEASSDFLKPTSKEVQIRRRIPFQSLNASNKHFKSDSSHRIQLQSPEGRKYAVTVRQGNAQQDLEALQSHTTRLITVRGELRGSGNRLLKELEKQDITTGLESLGSSVTNTNGITIIVDDGVNSILTNPSDEEFGALKGLVTASSKVLWINLHKKDAGLRNSASGLAKGFARTICAEQDALKVVVFDVQDPLAACVSTLATAVAQILVKLSSVSDQGEFEPEYVLRDQQIFIPRLRPAVKASQWIARSNGEAVLTTSSYGTQHNPLRAHLEIGKPLGSVAFERDESVSGPLEPGQIDVVPLVHGITSYDSAMFLDAVPFQSAWPLSHSSGVVQSVAKGMSAFAPGDAVICIGGAKLSSHIRTTPGQLYRLPQRVSLEQASTAVIPYMTAYRALFELAGLEDGDTILIEAGLDSLSHAAISLAQYAKADILVVTKDGKTADALSTASQLPRSRISQSQLIPEMSDKLRAKRFQILFTATSQHDEELDDLVVESGYVISSRTNSKRLPSTNSKASYVNIDLPAYATMKPKKLQKLFKEAMDVFCACNNHRLTPPMIYPMRRALDALRAARDPEQDVVLEAGQYETVESFTSESPMQKLAEDGTFVIAGGLGDIGRHVCQQIVDRGAKSIAILSRRVMTTEKRLSILQELGPGAENLRLESIACDVSQECSVQAAAQQITELSMPPVRGVFQSAVVLHDRVLENMTAEDYAVPLQAKYLGTRNLQRAFQSPHLDFFIMFSSLSGIVGSRGQANYAAANTYQDAFAQTAQDSRTHFMALNLGMMNETSAYDDNKAREANLMRQGWIPCSQDYITGLLDYAMSNEARVDQCRQLTIGLNGESIAAADNPTPMMQSAMFSHIRLASSDSGQSKTSGSNEPLKQVVAQCKTDAEAVTAIAKSLANTLANLVAVSVEAVSLESPIGDYGLDSLTAIELKNWIARELDATVQPSEILDEQNITSLAQRVFGRVDLTSTRGESEKEGEKASEIATSVVASSTTSPSKCELPQLPLPGLEATLKLYDDSVQPFLGTESSTEFSRLVQDFGDTLGPKLQGRLTELFQKESTVGWAHTYMANVYLKNRSPIYPNGTFYGTYPACASGQSQSQVAACITQAALEFKSRLSKGDFNDDSINGEPLCTDALKWFFNTDREPHSGQDKLRKHGDSNHVAVLRRGHIYKLEFSNLPSIGQLAELKNRFERIITDSEASAPALPTLTADNRDQWAEMRQRLVELEGNRKVLEDVESAAFVICLDDQEPVSKSSRCDHFMQGPADNRWSDKSLQFAVCANGAAGHIVEHSGLDGISVKQLTEFMEAAMARKPEPTEATLSQTNTSVMELEVKLNDEARQRIGTVASELKSQHVPAELEHFELPIFNAAFIRENKIPSKATVNICVQLASLLHFGVQHPAWEAVSTATFDKGRIDWMQSVQEPVFRFCENASRAIGSAGTPAVELASLEELFRKAAKSHGTNLTRAARGRGFMTHMLLLQAMVENGEQMPTIFEHDTWKQWHVNSQRKLKTDTSVGAGSMEAGFTMPDPESLLVHYEVLDEKTTFWVQGKGGNAREFCTRLETAADMIAAILKEKEVE